MPKLLKSFSILFLIHTLSLWATELALHLEELSLIPPTSIIMPSSWAERHDIFNTQSDLQALLSKSQISGILPIKNNTNSPIILSIFGKNEATASITQIDIAVNPGETNSSTSFCIYENLELKEGSSGFINLGAVPDNKLKCYKVWNEKESIK